MMTTGRSILKFARISTKKMKPILRDIQGKNAKEADMILALLHKKGAKLTRKVLKSAVASLREKTGTEIPEEKIIVKVAKSDKGLTMKRVRPFWRGMATLIRKRTSHITIEVVEGGE